MAKGMKWLCVVLVLVAATVLAAPLVDKDDLKPSFLVQTAKPSFDSDEDLIGGFGKSESLLTKPLSVPPPQTSSLLQEDEGSHKKMAAPIAEQINTSTEEVAKSQGSNAVMQSSGVGHMVGVNEPTFQREVKPVDILAVQVDDKDKELAVLHSTITLLRSDTTAAEQAQLQLAKQDELKLDELKQDLDSKIQATQQQLQEQLNSFKREAAMKVKGVRNEEDKTAGDMVSAKQSEEKEFVDHIQTQLAATNARIADLESRVKTANQKSEEVYVHTRQAWKQKRHDELEAKGVGAQVEKMQSEISLLKTKKAKLTEEEEKLKTQLKLEARDKILMAARMKNLHHREEMLKDTEATFLKDNESLKHQVDEIKLTQTENAVDIARAREEIQKQSIQAVEEAKSKAEVAERSFEESTLNGAKAEISKLKLQIQRKESRDGEMELQMLQQEHNVQAEKKEADDQLLNAQWEAQRAAKQIDLERTTSTQKAKWIVDEARRKAAKIREDARVAGMKAAEEQVRLEKLEENVRGQQLVQEEGETRDLAKEFRERTEKQLKEFELTSLEKFKQREAELHQRMLRSSSESVSQAQGAAAAQAAQVSRDTEVMNRHVAEIETGIAAATKRNQSLKAEIAKVQSDMVREKQELTAQLLGA
eukprot:c12641_g1_i2.p1 GENE.c12641_g1_i2~~c12641_g1_i2.p1  ORF type:complete len:647 (+),score=214.60 c12641_g1_i2:35-1975(+)